ncbi:hypothetical protein [Mycobacterium leprae]|uniref:hypothetical protein n=1 Tax=Mycobacterium leprae TaxID=1769 RepID=UPI0012E8368F|nr:hypothetical protein [Mycobacterium leprae]
MPSRMIGVDPPGWAKPAIRATCVGQITPELIQGSGRGPPRHLDELMRRRAITLDATDAASICYPGNATNFSA